EGVTSTIAHAGETLLLTVGRDATDRRRAEQALAESEARLRLALRAGALGTFDWDLASDTITWSETTERLFGFVPGSFDGRYESFFTRIHADDRRAVAERVERALR